MYNLLFSLLKIEQYLTVLIWRGILLKTGTFIYLYFWLFNTVSYLHRSVKNRYTTFNNRLFSKANKGLISDRTVNWEHNILEFQEPKN